MMKSKLLTLASLCILPNLGNADPLTRCYNVQTPGVWAEIRINGVDGAPGNAISAGDGLTYSFSGATLVSVQADTTGEWDWVTVYAGGDLVLNNVPSAPWYNPHQLQPSITVDVPQAVVRTRSTRFVNDADTSNDNHAEFTIFAETALVSFSAEYAGEPIIEVEGSDKVVGDALDKAQICISGGNIDVRQGTLNVKSKGVLPVVLFGTETFDVRMLKSETIKLAGAPALRSVLTDVNADGLPDLNLKFSTPAVAKTLVSIPDKSITSLSFTATMADGVTIVTGSDDIRVLNKSKPAKPVKPAKPQKKAPPAKGKK